MNNLTFRPALPADYLFIARGFHMAMLMDDTDEEQIRRFADTICKRDDVLYCARNTIIAELDGQAVGMVTAYDGRRYREMAERTFAIVKKEMGIEFPGMEAEAVPGEYYIDSLAVWPEYRGKGIGRALLTKAIETGRHIGTVTLAVDPDNPTAERLYESLGFRYVGNLFIFGHDYRKMAYID